MDIGILNQRIYNAWGIRIFVYERTLSLLSDLPEANTGSRLVIPQELLLSMKQRSFGKDSPTIHFYDDSVYFVSFFESENLVVLGPISVVELQQHQRAALFQNLGVKASDCNSVKLPQLSVAEALPVISLIYFSYTGKEITEEEILNANKIPEKEYVQRASVYQIPEYDEEERRNSYQEELEWKHAIRTGMLHRDQNIFSPENLDKLNRIGVLTAKETLKQYEYMAISGTCLASRAAMEAGVKPYEAYKLSDYYYQKVSSAGSVVEYLTIHVEASQAFSELVRKYLENKRKNDYVEQAIDYINRHRNGKISFSDMASELGVNRSYLSRIFSQRMGTTLQAYALDLKLQAAADILCYSDSTVGEVIDYLGFSSHSYFGQCFKRKFGVSPHDYRNQNKVVGSYKKNK